VNQLLQVAERFFPGDEIKSIEEFGNGNINQTFLVSLDSPTRPRAILQKMNTKIFRNPELVMRNIRIFSEHARRHLAKNPLPGNRLWQIPEVIPTDEGKDFFEDGSGKFWRALSYIENSTVFETIQNLDHAKEIGATLGIFHALLSDLPSERLADTLEGFHITPRYLKAYEVAVAARPSSETREEKLCRDFIEDRKELVYVLENAKNEGKLALRVIHGDPKINNIMIDISSGKAVSIVDLDTIKPGLVHYDIGDCLRSGGNLLGEETSEWEKVSFDIETGQAILHGYLSETKHFLNSNDYDLLFDGIRLIAFELGLRFFTDHLQGNVYFKARTPDHNLKRALVQFQLCKSIESQEASIRKIIEAEKNFS